MDPKFYTIFVPFDNNYVAGFVKFYVTGFVILFKFKLFVGIVEESIIPLNGIPPDVTLFTEFTTGFDK